MNTAGQKWLAHATNGPWSLVEEASQQTSGLARALRLLGATAAACFGWARVDLAIRFVQAVTHARLAGTLERSGVRFRRLRVIHDLRVARAGPSADAGS